MCLKGVYSLSSPRHDHRVIAILSIRNSVAVEKSTVKIRSKGRGRKGHPHFPIYFYIGYKGISI